MENMKAKLTDAVAARLSAAPRSADKDELIEELSDNLYRRFLDMTGAGMDEEAAFNRAMDDLGDVDELLAYLGVKPDPDVNIAIEPDGRRITISGADGDTPAVINNPGDGEPVTINTEDAGQEESRPQDAPADDQSQGWRDEHGDVHYDYSDGSIPQSDLDAIMANVAEICKAAMGQVKDAVKQATESVKRRSTYRSNGKHHEFRFDASPTPPTPPTPPIPPTPPEQPKGWEFEAELDSDEGRFFAGAGPKQRRDIIYGFGYDKAKGGFFAQWGEYKGEYKGGASRSGPSFTGEGAFIEHQDGDSYSVTALKDLRGIQVMTSAGDVVIHVDQAPDEGVIIDGDVNDLDVTCSADGILTIREGRTASSSFFSRRGIGSADVELFLPCRLWESIEVSTASGDVSIEDGLEIEHLAVTTASGDLECELKSCSLLHFKSASGDLHLMGDCMDLRTETMSGDVHLEGQVDRAELKSASGDILLDGSVGLIRAASMSGDVEMETAIMPQAMDLSSKSGDCRARIPDAAPFTLRFKTVSGDVDLDFPFQYNGKLAVYGDGSGPTYSITSVSGDVTVQRY